MKIFNITAALCLLVCTAGCTSDHSDQKSIGVIAYDGDDAFISSLTDCFVQEAQQKNLQIDLQEAGRSQITENNIVHQMIDDGTDLLCINLVDRTDPSEIINAARNAEVPVIFFNREPVAGDLDRWNKLYYVGGDAAESGRLQAQIAIEYFSSHPEADRNQDGKIQYYVLEGEPGHQDAIIRTESSVNALEDGGMKLAKQGYAICDWNRTEAESAVSKLIRSQTDIDLLLANNDEMAAGAAAAYDENHISLQDRPVIIGVDGTETGLQLVQSNQMLGTVYNDYAGQADMMLQIALRILEGKSTKDLGLKNGNSAYLPYQAVTIDNVSDFMK